MNGLQTIHRVGNQRGGSLHILWSRGIGQVFQVVNVVRAPGCALVRKNMRIVEVKVVNDVRIVQRIEKQQLALRRPVRARNDDGVLRRSLANRHRKLRLHALPPVAVTKFWLVQYLERNKLRIRERVVPCQLPPVVLELLDEIIVRGELLLKVGIGVKVDDHRQAVIENHLYGRIEIP